MIPAPLPRFRTRKTKKKSPNNPFPAKVVFFHCEGLLFRVSPSTWRTEKVSPHVVRLPCCVALKYFPPGTFIEWEGG